MVKWGTTDHGDYIEVMPLSDVKEHYAGDECWCNPAAESTTGIPMITHNLKQETVMDNNANPLKLDIENFLKSMEGQVVKFGEPEELIARLARSVDNELDELYNRISELERRLGL